MAIVENLKCNVVFLYTYSNFKSKSLYTRISGFYTEVSKN